MNQRACLYFKKKEDLRSFYLLNGDKLKDISNKFRACILIAEGGFSQSNDFFLKGPDENSIVEVYDISVHFLTYQQDPIYKMFNEVLIIDELIKYWFSDIDVWVGFPHFIETEVKKMGPHTFSYSYEKFFEIIRT